MTDSAQTDPFHPLQGQLQSARGAIDSEVRTAASRVSAANEELSWLSDNLGTLTDWSKGLGRYKLPSEYKKVLKHAAKVQREIRKIGHPRVRQLTHECRTLRLHLLSREIKGLFDGLEFGSAAWLIIIILLVELLLFIIFLGR